MNRLRTWLIVLALVLLIGGVVCVVVHLRTPDPVDEIVNDPGYWQLDLPGPDSIMWDTTPRYRAEVPLPVYQGLVDTASEVGGSTIVALELLVNLPRCRTEAESTAVFTRVYQWWQGRILIDPFPPKSPVVPDSGSRVESYSQPDAIPGEGDWNPRRKRDWPQEVKRP